MKGYNNCQFIGNLGNDPELRYTGGGLAMTTASLAVNGTTQIPDGTMDDSTLWLRLVFFGREAEKMGRLGTKGGSIFVKGKLQTRPYADRGGVIRQAIEIVVDESVLLNGHTPREAGDHRYDSDDDDSFGPPPGTAPPRSDNMPQPAQPVKVREHQRSLPNYGSTYGPLEATVVNAPLPAPRRRTTTRKAAGK